MKNCIKYFSLLILSTLLILGCDDDNPSSQNEVWPKSGYLFTNDSDLDTVYVESGSIVVTRAYLPQYPIQDNSKKWTITLPGSGEGVFIHNDDNEYWSIDSAFHPTLKVEQHFISTIKVSNTANLGKENRFKYHKDVDGKRFYIESVKFPKYFVNALGHAENSGGLVFRKQEKGDWAFWLGNE
jgi:hypothetical protein